MRPPTCCPDAAIETNCRYAGGSCRRSDDAADASADELDALNAHRTAPRAMQFPSKRVGADHLPVVSPRAAARHNVWLCRGRFHKTQVGGRAEPKGTIQRGRPPASLRRPSVTNLRYARRGTGSDRGTSGATTGECDALSGARPSAPRNVVHPKRTSRFHALLMIDPTAAARHNVGLCCGHSVKCGGAAAASIP